MKSVEYTITVGRMFAQHVARQHARRAVAPRARAALHVLGLARDQHGAAHHAGDGGQPQMPTAIVVLSTPGPSADTTAMASRR